MDTFTHKQMRGIFDAMEHSLFTLNATVISKTKEFEVKQDISNKMEFIPDETK